MAAGKMTVVGTRGYTAPEVLKGEHYGPPADVFSFAIVMCEVITLRFAYESYVRDENGAMIATWEQIVEMTKRSGLRPELGTEVPSRVSKLIRESWDPDPERRPTFSVILARLANVVTGSQIAGSRKMSQEYAQEVMSPNQRRGHVEREMREVTEQFFNVIQSHKEGMWKASLAADIIEKEARADAKDAVLSAVLRGRKGPECARSIGQIIFGGLDANWEVVPEPLLDDHITVR